MNRNCTIPSHDREDERSGSASFTIDTATIKSRGARQRVIILSATEMTFTAIVTV